MKIYLKPGYKYTEWVRQSLKSEKKLDYFSFADECSKFDLHKTELITNSLYKSLLNTLSRDQPKSCIAEAEAARLVFSKRTSISSEFGARYDKYWTDRRVLEGEQGALEVIKKRRREVLVELNNDTCDDIARMSKRSCGKENENEEPQNSKSTEPLRPIPPPLHSHIKEIIAVSETSGSSVGCLGILDLGSTAVMELVKTEVEESARLKIMSQVNIPACDTTPEFRDLVSKLLACPCSTISIRSIVRGNNIQNFDAIVHADVNICEILVTHFLNLMDSPRNPLTSKVMERTAATLTTIPILNQLFQAENDIIEMKWIEIQCLESEDRKWDGIAFSRCEDKLVPVLIELAGGIATSGMQKKNADLVKLYKHATSTLNRLCMHKPLNTMPRVFCVLFFDKELYFESLSRTEDDIYVRKCHLQLRCPTTPRELLHFVSQIGELLNWKKAVLDSIVN